jgi:LysR family transcriptional regulator, glycine cleavage system transcriptional activator
MRSLPLNALRAFALAVDKGGVRAAARELAVSHSAVSRHLSELERRLGVGLFDRSGGARSFIVTPQGQRLAGAVLGAMNEIRSALDAVREQRSRHAVTLSIAPSFAARWLLPRLSAFERGHPHVEVSILVDQRLDDLRASGSDLAIRMGPGPWPGVGAQLLMNDALYPVMSPEAWKKAGRPRVPADLRHLRLLHDRDPYASWSAWRDEHGPENLDVRKGPRFSSSDLVLRAAAQGLGVALARYRLVADDLDTGVLIRPFGAYSVAIDNAYWIITRSAGPAREVTTTMIAWLQQAAARQREDNP